jgi:hypothetical protein
MLDFWGNELKRYYTLETLENATNAMLTQHDRFVASSVRDVAGGSPLVSLTFELFQEGAWQLIYRLRVVNGSRKEAVFAFVVAKNHQECTRVAEAEHANLRVLYARAPQFVVRPFGGGQILLPPGKQKPGERRPIYAYLTQWLGTYHELGVEKDLSFYINVMKPHRLTKVQTEELKSRIVETVLRSYDPAKRECMEMPQIASGDFVVTKPNQGPLKIKLIACRRMLHGVSPSKLIHTIVSTKWDWAEKEFRIVPEVPEAFFEALVRARGMEDARSYLKSYRQKVLDGAYPEQQALNKKALERLCKK